MKKTSLQKAQEYADLKVPLLEDYHEWKKHKESFLAGWKECESQQLETMKEIINDPYKSESA